MSKKLVMRAEAILDGVTAVVRIPSIKTSYGRDHYPRRHRQSDVERSWSFVGNYMRIAIQEHDAEIVNAPIIRESKTEA